jgi:DNA-binding response OmpR family regulator
MPAQTEVSLPLILVAHHNAGSVELLRSLLEGEGYAVLCAYNGRAAHQLIHQHRPRLLLLDQELPLVGGRQLCHTLRQESGSPAIFILSDRTDELGKLLAFGAGADDYLQLPMHPHELLGRVKVALRWASGAGQPVPPVVRYGRLELRPEQRLVRAAGQDVPLTSLEYELLSIFAQHPRRVFTRDELLNRLSTFLRGTPFSRTVDIHVSNLRHKLRQSLGEDLPIETVRGVGYRLRSEGRNEHTAAPEREDDRSTGLEHVALAALDRAPMPLLVLSLDRTVLLYNDAARQLCGWKTEEVAGQVKCYSLLGCHNSAGTMLCHDACPMRQTLLAGLNDHQAHYIITLKDGRELPVTAHYTRLGNTGSQRDCVLLALQPEAALRHDADMGRP